MKWLRNKLLKHLYKAVTVHDLQKEWKKLNEDTQKQYKAEAQAILKYEVTHWLKGEMEKEAMRKMYLKSKTDEDLIFGKATLHSETERHNTLNIIAKS